MSTPYYICPTGIKLANGSTLQLAHAASIAKQSDGSDPPTYNQNSNPSAGTVESASEPYYNFAPATKDECTITKDWDFPLPNGYSIKMHRVGTVSGDFGRVTLSGGIYEGSTLRSAFPGFNGAVFHTASGLVGRLGLVASYDMANPKQFSYMGIYFYDHNTGGDADAYARYSGNNIYQYVTERDFTGLPGPYDAGGISDEGGGGGSFTQEDDARPIPSLPSFNLCDSGLISVYSLTQAQIKSFGQYLWSSFFDADTFKKMFDNPMECIISLGILPGFVNVSVTNVDLYIGNTDTGLDVKAVEDQFYEIDMGFVELPEYWGAYLDYNPYTKLKMIVPYCGEVDLNPDDVMGKYVGLVYHVDVITGACTAYITAGEGSGGGARNDVYYTLTGNMLLTIPLCATDYKQAFSGLLNYAKTVIGAGVAGALTGGAAGAAIGVAGGVAGGLASNVMNMKHNYQRSGAMGSAYGVLGEQKPYIYIDRPRQALPADQHQFTGYPSFMTVQLSDLSGYTELERVHLENIHATSAELDEIESLLKGGVYL